MNLIKTLILSLILLAFAFESSTAQNSSRLTKSKLYAGYNSFGIIKLAAGGGISWYHGDVCDACFTPKVNLNLGAQMRFTERISVKGELNWYQIGAKDLYESRGADFRSNNLEILGALMVDLFPYSVNYYSRKMFNPYLYAGFGFTYFNPRAEVEGEVYSLRPLQTEGVSYSPVSLILPGGIGVRMKATQFLDLSLEMGYRITFTDYLDDVSTVYTDYDDPTTALVAARGTARGGPGRKRGNPDSRDGYAIVSLKAELTLPSVRGGSGGSGKRDSGAHISKLTKKNRQRLLKNRR